MRNVPIFGNSCIVVLEPRATGSLEFRFFACKLYFNLTQEYLSPASNGRVAWRMSRQATQPSAVPGVSFT